MVLLKKPKIVVLGAGYGGLMTVTRLQKSLKQNEAEIVLINQNSYHYETTWLHKASAGTLHPDRVRFPIESVINKSKVKFIQDFVVQINMENKRVILQNGEISYDYLVIGLGPESETFEVKGITENAFTISNVNSAQMLRKHIQLQFATYQSEKVKQDSRLTFVVGGAGLTGIEFLGELTNHIPLLCKKYQIDFEKIHIYCVEAASKVLPEFDFELVEYAVSSLKKSGVEFRIGTAIQEVTSEGIIISSGEDEVEEIKSSTVVWTAGVRGNSIIETSGFKSIRGRVQVNSDLRVPGYEDIFVVGDCALIMNKESNRPYPMTAQMAMQQGKLVAKNLTRLIRQQTELEPLIYHHKGTICSLGHHDAIGAVFGKKVKGRTALWVKKMEEKRVLYIMGGPSLFLKKGSFKFYVGKKFKIKR